MTSVILGDIINSRKVVDAGEWLYPLKRLLEHYGKEPAVWTIERGDTFQLEVADPSTALKAALSIKSLIKSLEVNHLDVRMAIGIGEKSFQGSRISESNGEAFVNCGDAFEVMKQSKQNLAIKTPWQDLDREMNLMLRLGSLVMDKWTASSAKVMYLQFIAEKKIGQKELTQLLHINQSSVSERLTRAHSHEITELEQYFRDRIKQKIEE